MKYPHLASILILVLTSDIAWPQVKVDLPAAKNGKLANLVPVMCPSARCGALSETSGWLAFGHEQTFPDAHVSLFRLDAKGNPAAYSIPLKLPRPAGLIKHPNYPIALAFHPKLPLLYVWQDVAVPYTNPQGALPPDLQLFDHLVIFNLAKDPPELLASLCRGPQYAYGMGGGGLVAESTGAFLYVPSLKDAKNAGMFMFGRFPLDPDGLPRVDEAIAKLPMPGRAKSLTDLNVAKPVFPPQVTPTEHVELFPTNSFGCGTHFVSVSRDVTIGGGTNGLVTWRPDDKRCLLSALSVPGPTYRLFTPHPTLPAMYVTLYNTPVLARVEQSEGYLSLVPQYCTLPDANLLSPPTVLAKAKKVVVGGQFRVYVISLDDQGRCLPGLIQVPILNPNVKALIYSERHDKVYVSMEVSR
jgi:hypothetical protein